MPPPRAEAWKGRGASPFTVVSAVVAVRSGAIKPREASAGSAMVVATWAAAVVKWWPVITKHRTSTIP